MSKFVDPNYINKDICIFGYSTVGQAIHRMIKPNEKQVAIVDPAKGYELNVEPEEFIKKFGIVYICAHTPSDPVEFNSEDFTCILDIAEKLVSYNYKGLVVLVSTTPPQVVNELIRNYELNFIVQPEFITDNNAFSDISTCGFVVVGGDFNLIQKLALYYEEYTIFSQNLYIFKPDEACYFKYIWNTHNALEVLFWNFVHEVTGNSRKYAGIFNEIYFNKIKPNLTQVAADGKLGYGGKCFPKDINTFNLYNHHELLDFMKHYNARLRYGLDK